MLTARVSLTLILAVGLMGQTRTTPPSLSDTDPAIEGLLQVSRELNESVKRFYSDLDQTIARQDRGYRLQNRPQVQGADVDLTSGAADLMFAAIRKFAVFRMLAARNETYEPAPVADMDRLQQLITEARKRVDNSTAILRRLLVVSVTEMDPRKDAAVKDRHDRLLKARAAAEESARRALLAFPLEQTEASLQDETAQKAWDHMRRDPQALKEKSASVPPSTSIAMPSTTPAIPIRLERRKRVTLINETSCRMAMTDSGIEDDRGRHIFYQEEWAQRGVAVVRFRWRVAVETSTGRHVLLKRYPPLELHGDLEDLYNHRDRDYLWYLEPPDDSTEPVRNDLESALAEVSRAREAVRNAARDFKSGIREALAQQDRLHAAVNAPPVDSGLPDEMRQTLFTIRAHISGVPALLQSEDNVRRAISQAELAVRTLEPLAAWCNRAAQTAALDWAQLLDRSDREINSLRSAETEALTYLPPDSSRAEDQFPAIEKNVIVRIRRTHSKNPQDTAVRCLQEIWRMERGMLGVREVMRMVNLILIDPQTGNQTRVGEGTRYYKASPDSLLEEIYDEYAADEVSLGS